jgi:hypothetical protein
LKLEKGRTYVFELNSVITEFDVTGNPTTTSKSKTEIHFDIEKFNGETLIFTSKTISSVSEKPDSKVKSITNLKFPFVVNDVNASFNPISTITQLLSLTELRYKVDLENNNVEFLNKQDALDEVRSIMEAKGFNDEFIAKGTDFMEKENAIWQRIHEAHQFILYFNQSVKTNDKFLKSKFPDKSFQRKENEEYIQGEKKLNPEQLFQKQN